MLTNPMTDLERELAIQREGLMIEAAMLLANANGNEYFMHRGDADRHRIVMESLIRGRSPAQVAKLEQARGLSHA